MRNRWTAAATEIFAKTKYAPDEKDIALLAQSMALVDAAGLRELIERLTQANRKIFDTIAELNFAVMLVRHLGSSGIEYEPADYGPRPVDFRIREQASAIHLQMKRFGDLERDNRRDAVHERIKQSAAGIDVQKFFAVTVREGFSEEHVAGLIQLLEATSPNAPDGHVYDFEADGVVLAKVEFWQPKTSSLANLTLGATSDAEAVNITGLAKDQLRASLRKAAGAFIAPVDGSNLNLIVAESDRHHDIDICEACFGTEEELIAADGRHAWHRRGDGVFAEAGIAEKVAGLVVLRRPDRSRPVSDYEALLLVNEPHLQWVDQIRRTIPIAKVVRYNMRP